MTFIYSHKDVCTCQYKGVRQAFGCTWHLVMPPIPCFSIKFKLDIVKKLEISLDMTGLRSKP